MSQLEQTSDDAIIAAGLLAIRNGIVDGNWDLVCNGYNNISGENLTPNPVPPPSRLDRIREMMNPPNTNSVEPAETPVVAKPRKKAKLSKSHKELVAKLIKLGATEETLFDKTESDLLMILAELKSTQEPVIKDTVVKQEGRLKIITGGTNAVEAEINQRRSGRSADAPRREHKPIETLLGSGSDVKFISDPPKKPSWR